jgi:ABC-type multidrug transport system permease subunit
MKAILMIAIQPAATATIVEIPKILTAITCFFLDIFFPFFVCYQHFWLLMLQGQCRF